MGKLLTRVIDNQKRIQSQRRSDQGTDLSQWNRAVLTLASDTSIPSNADPLADPIGEITQRSSICAPAVLSLPFMLEVVILTGDELGQDDPFRDGRPMDTRRGRYCNLAVFHNRMIYPVVDAGGEEVDEFKTEGMGWTRQQKRVRKLTVQVGLGKERKSLNSLWGCFFIRWQRSQCDQQCCRFE